MIKYIGIQSVSLIYLLLLTFIFIKKRKKEHKKEHFESNIFEILLLLTSLVLISDIGMIVTNIIYGERMITKTISKIYLILAIIWSFWLVVYVFLLNSGQKYQGIKNLFKKSLIYRLSLFLTFFLAIGSIFLKQGFIVDEAKNMISLNGQDMYYTYIVSFIYMGVMTIYMIINPKKITFNKRIPIYIFLFLGLSAIVLEWVYHIPSLVSSVMAFIMLFIYFLMENPDLQIISDLEKDKEEVEVASKAKTDFLSNMSHDIRTPMNAIIGFSESLLMENLSDYQHSEVQNIYEAATTLLQIINNILDVSRIESGKEEKVERKYEIKKLIMQLTSVLTAKIDVNKIRLNVQMDTNVPEVLIGDELKLYQILMNLLSNAGKYTNEGQIELLITSENIGDTAKIKFVVKDTGIGIKESDYSKMFVKFSRIHNEENYQTIEGTGLGLVITKSLVELLGGTIDFTSEYGKGTTFTVIIPQKIVAKEESETLVNQITKSASASNVHFDGSLYDVLVVDDNELNLKVANRILSDYHFQIMLAGTGDEAINLLKQGRRFDIIFLDHMMPIKDGIETLKEIKEIEGIKVPPVIALTANAMVGMKEKYLAEGFDGYISKPINREELGELLNNIFCKK